MRTQFLVCIVSIFICAAAPARAEGRCIGWAVPGGLLGMMGGGLATSGLLRLGGASPSDALPTRDTVLLVAGLAAGATGGMVGSCALFGHEAHLLPAAALVAGGAALGGAIGYGFASGALAPSTAAGCRGSAAPDCGQSVLLFSGLAMLLGAAAGGVGGYYLHVRLFGESGNGGYLVPMASRQSAGLLIGARM